MIETQATPAPTAEVFNVQAAVDSTVRLWEQILPYIKNVGLAILYLVLGLIFIALVKRTTKRVLNKSTKVDKGLGSFLVSTVDISLKALLLVGIIATLGIETTSIVAVLGAASFTVGIALQGSLSNFAGGVMLLLFKPFKVGDYVECQDYSGTVVDMNIFSTILDTFDKKRVIVPNSIMSQGPLINYTTNETRRVDITVGVDYNSDIDETKKVLTHVLTSHDRVLRDPAPLVRVKELADSSINFTAYAWVKTEDYWDVFFDLNEGIKKTLDRNNIEIPYPHMTIVNKK